jgi:4a-hydroxytetrahydrobiopterin dehydratase
MTLSEKKCVPCEGGVQPLSENEANNLIKSISGWSIVGEINSIKRKFKFKNFAEALEFTNKVGEIAEQEDHHPDIMLGWGYCDITLKTHSIDGLHENDFIVASKINGMS